MPSGQPAQTRLELALVRYTPSVVHRLIALEDIEEERVATISGNTRFAGMGPGGGTRGPGCAGYRRVCAA
jgi:hypothetical protein